MTNKKKIILSTSILLPTAIICTSALASCSSTHPFIKPNPINLNNSISSVDNLLKTYNTKLNSMVNFNDVFKFQDEILSALNSDAYDFDNNVSSVVIDISPQYTNSLLIYEYSYQINFKMGVDVNFNPDLDYTFSNNRLISPKTKLVNPQLSNKNSSICFWISNASVVDSSYISLTSNINSFVFNYNNENYNVVKYKRINTNLSTFTNINVYINKVIANTDGKNWLNVDDEAKEVATPKKNITLDVSYRTTDANINIPQKTLETNQYSFTINATQSSNK